MKYGQKNMGDACLDACFIKHPLWQHLNKGMISPLCWTSCRGWAACLCPARCP